MKVRMSSPIYIDNELKTQEQQLDMELKLMQHYQFEMEKLKTHEQQLDTELKLMQQYQLEMEKLKKVIAERQTIVKTVQDIKKQVDFTEFKKNLEEEGMQKVAALKQSNLPLESNLTTIMQTGFDTFQKETGKLMTYSEMRELYG